MFDADRWYWGIENGLHLRLDVTAGEDRSRVRNPVSVLNLAMIRRATISVAVDWIRRCRNKRQATLQGFYDFMSVKNHRKAFALVTAAAPSWSPPYTLVLSQRPVPSAFTCPRSLYVGDSSRLSTLTNRKVRQGIGVL